MIFKWPVEAWKVPKTQKITLDKIRELRQIHPRRRCFLTHTGIQKAKQNGSITFSVNFADTIAPIYETMTGFNLRYNSKFNNYWHLLRPDELPKAESWEKGQGSRIFIRDNLSLSLALAEYSTDPHERTRTYIGDLEQRAKYNQDLEALNELVQICYETIQSLPFYSQADYVCAVPARIEKSYDLPRRLSELVSTAVGKPDLTPHFRVGDKTSIREAPLETKLDRLEEANFQYTGASLQGKKVILIDDLYQSGTTIQFIGMKLQHAGALEIYGLSLVKGMRDSDNQ